MFACIGQDGTEKISSSNIYIFPVNYHSTNGPRSFIRHSKDGQWGPLDAAGVQIHIKPPRQNKNFKFINKFQPT
jgi:hypothetical protein